MGFLQLIFATFVVLLISTVLGSENCFEAPSGQGLLKGQRTDCVGFFSRVPWYLIYPENGLASNSSPIAVAFVSGQLGGFNLVRDRDLEEDCPTFFHLSSSNIDSWVSSLNAEDVVNSLNDICFDKYFFAERAENLFSFRVLYKVSAENVDNGGVVYKPRKLAVSTSGGEDFIFLAQNEDLAQICTTCSRSDDSAQGSNNVSELTQSSNLADVLNGLK